VQLAKPRAEVTLNTPIFQHMPIAGFHRVMGNKSSHCPSPGTVKELSCHKELLTSTICDSPTRLKYPILICKDFHQSLINK
jgi:hypothetical protein